MNNYAIPKHLISEIRAGHCVAFIGAGFSAAAQLPSWSTLLRHVIDTASKEGLFPSDKDSSNTAKFLHDLVDGAGNNHENYDMCAQMLQDMIGMETVSRLMGDRLAVPTPLPEDMEDRLNVLKGIPFKAVLTTNYDLLLTGETPDSDPPYEQILRHRRDSHHQRRIVNQQAASHNDAQLPWPVVKIHGCVSKPKSMVWTRTGYRQLINEVPGYMHFLRTLIATSTILYIGFSFSDGYLNEIRGEVLSMLYGNSSKSYIANLPPEIAPAAAQTAESSSSTGVRYASTVVDSAYISGGRCMTHPLGYAIVHDKSAHEKDFFLSHEGVQILSWSTRAPDGTKDYSGLEKYLQNIYALTSPFYYLGKLAWGHRILMLMKYYEVGTANSQHVAISMAQPSKKPFQGSKTAGGENNAGAGEGGGDDGEGATASRVANHVRGPKEVEAARKQLGQGVSDLPQLLADSIQKYRDMRQLMQDGDASSVFSGHSGADSEGYNSDDNDAGPVEGEEKATGESQFEYHRVYEEGGKLSVVYDDVDVAIKCMKQTKYDFVVTVYGWRDEQECLLEEFVGKMRTLPFDHQAPFIVTTSSEGIKAKRKQCTRIGAADVTVTIGELVEAVMRLLERLKH